MKLISICPSNTELLAYLGLTHSIIGVDNFSDWPEHVNALPRLGPDLNIDMDKVEELKPDLVLASLSVPGMEKNIERLKERNIPHVVVPNPKTLKEVGESLRFVGKATNTLDKAEQLYEKYNAIIKDYHLLSKQVENRKTIYWEWWAKPIFTPGATNWLTEMSELAGGRNVFQDRPESSVRTDWEEVKRRNPDVMFIVWVGVQKQKVNLKVILNRPESENVKAIKNKHMYILDEPLFCRPSPRLLIGLNQIANILHPDIFPQYVENEDPLMDSNHLN